MTSNRPRIPGLTRYCTTCLPSLCTTMPCTYMTTYSRHRDGHPCIRCSLSSSPFLSREKKKRKSIPLARMRRDSPCHMPELPCPAAPQIDGIGGGGREFLVIDGRRLLYLRRTSFLFLDFAYLRNSQKLTGGLAGG